MQTTTHPHWHPTTLIPDPRHPSPRHLPDLLLDAVEAQTLEVIEFCVGSKVSKFSPRYLLRRYLYFVAEACFGILRKILGHLSPHPYPDISRRNLRQTPQSSALLLESPDIDYAEFAQYDTLQKEFQHEAAGNASELEWKTTFLDLTTEQELLERYVDWAAEGRQEAWENIGNVPDAPVDFAALAGLERELLIDHEEVLEEQTINRSRFSKDESDEEALWKKIIKFRRETLRQARGERRSVLDKYGREIETRGVRGRIG